MGSGENWEILQFLRMSVKKGWRGEVGGGNPCVWCQSMAQMLTYESMLVGFLSKGLNLLFHSQRQKGESANVYDW